MYVCVDTIRFLLDGSRIRILSRFLCWLTTLTLSVWHALNSSYMIDQEHVLISKLKVG